MMKIEREKLLTDLQDFTSRGDGVIIGSPGVGKTYVLKELRQRLKSSEIPHLLLRIDQLGDGTAETLQEELSYKGDLIEKLKSIRVSGKNAILLFDAFDAARDEQTRKRFLNLIRRAIQELVKWNVVVTIRTYDAKKSRELLDLFGSPDDTQHQSVDILCRHFTIPPFNTDEIPEAFDQIGCPKSIYDDGSPDFKNILANPFNLWLLEKILKSSDGIPDFSQIHSEVQLLGLFWERRIENENSERVLRRISHRMVKERSLTVKVDDIYDDVNLDNPVRKNAWDKLQSDEILAKVSSTGQRIAFSHNILFDYAISVLLIDDEPQRLENFITEDPSRPLFLRASLTYFFTRLWYYDDSTSFWKAFWHIFPSERSIHLSLVARLIPTSVIANEAHKIEQLIPLLEELGNGEKGEIANEAITRLLQALQTLQIKRDTLWINFFDQVSRHLHGDFAWDLANLTSAILERTSESENSEVMNACGQIGRRLLKWVWQKREVGKSTWYDRFGGRWAVPLVAKTYHTNPEKSRMLLEKILGLPQEDNFPITFLSWLTEHVDKIWEHDPEFVTLIYRTVFHHNESSDAKTSLSSGVLAMTSTRRQDYSMCRYRLIKHFPGFLQAVPLSAAQSVIRSLNVFIVGEHIARYPKEGVKLEDMIEIFNFHGKPAYFIEDGSYIWDARNSSDEPIEMADTLFKFISELADSEKSLPLLDSLFDVFRDEVIVAFFWKRLLGIASQSPKTFAPRLFELCIAKPILRGNDTRYELGQFLEATASEFSSDQLRRIEESILALQEEATDKDSQNALTYRRNRLLERIPENLLVTDEAKQIRKKMVRENDIQENRPLVSFSTQTEDVTEEKWFQTQGVDINKSENQGLQRFSAPLNKFSSDWMNDVPTMEAAKLVLTQLQKAYTAVKSNTEADKEVMNSLWHKLAACVAILGRIANDLESREFAFCRQVLLEGAKHEKPKYDDQFDSAGYSPCARHEAASGLLRFAFYQPDIEILDAIETLANDAVSSVRMVTARELFQVYDKAPERFWDIVNNRAKQEKSHVVQEYLYLTLTQVITKAEENEDKTAQVMAKLLQHTPLPPEKSGSFDPFSYLLMGLAIGYQNSWAIGTIKNTFFKDPIRFANLLTRAVNEVMERYVNPKYFGTDAGCERAKRAIDWLDQVIDLVSDKIKELYRIVKEDETEENVKKLHDMYNVIDEVITRLYFAVAYKRDQAEEPVEEISHELRCDYYDKVEPLMKQIIDFAQTPGHGVMFAPTAHYFMQLLRSFLGCNPKEVLHLAAGVVKSSEQFGYTLDSIAVRDVVEFVEIVLADYRHEVRDGEALEDLLNLLDLFAKIGWSDALKLVWRLDEVFR